MDRRLGIFRLLAHFGSSLRRQRWHHAVHRMHITLVKAMIFQGPSLKPRSASARNHPVGSLTAMRQSDLVSREYSRLLRSLACVPWYLNVNKSTHQNVGSDLPITIDIHPLLSPSNRVCIDLNARLLTHFPHSLHPLLPSDARE